MTWLRWLFFCICAWSVTSAWADDKAAMPGTGRYNVYLISLGLVAILAILFEIRDVARARAKSK